MSTHCFLQFLNPLHEHLVKRRRAGRLAELITEFLPPHATSILDVGAGDGAIAASVARYRPGVAVQGVDVLVRSDALIPIQQFDGKILPFADGAFDCVLLIDVLHHTNDPGQLLGECLRVSKGCIILKDHYARCWLDKKILRFMDLVGNLRFGVHVPSNYLSPHQWRHHFNTLGLHPARTMEQLALYPRWADWLFGARLHFITRLEKTTNHDP